MSLFDAIREDMGYSNKPTSIHSREKFHPQTIEYSPHLIKGYFKGVKPSEVGKFTDKNVILMYLNKTDIPAEEFILDTDDYDIVLALIKYRFDYIYPSRSNLFTEKHYEYLLDNFENIDDRIHKMYKNIPCKSEKVIMKSLNHSFKNIKYLPQTPEVISKHFDKWRRDTSSEYIDWSKYDCEDPHWIEIKKIFIELGKGEYIPANLFTFKEAVLHIKTCCKIYTDEYFWYSTKIKNEFQRFGNIFGNEYIETVCKVNPQIVEYLPNRFMSKSIEDIAVEYAIKNPSYYNKYFLKNVSDEKKYFTYYIIEIPSESQTSENIKFGLSERPRDLEYVRLDLITWDLLYWLYKSKKVLYFPRNRRFDFITDFTKKDVILRILQLRPHHIRFFKTRSREMLKTAVGSLGYVLQHLTEEEQYENDAELIKLGTSVTPPSIRHIKYVEGREVNWYDGK